jgi:hypothetical protein
MLNGKFCSALAEYMQRDNGISTFYFLRNTKLRYSTGTAEMARVL